MKILYLWTWTTKNKNEELELEPTYEKQNMKILSVKLERTWTYLRKKKYEDTVEL